MVGIVVNHYLPSVHRIVPIVYVCWLVSVTVSETIMMRMQLCGRPTKWHIIVNPIKGKFLDVWPYCVLRVRQRNTYDCEARE